MPYRSGRDRFVGVLQLKPDYALLTNISESVDRFGEVDITTTN
ncbi:MAG: hypothetical protein ACLRTA_09020 [Clostridia bacterium]